MTEELPEELIYSAIGEEGFARLVGAFYRQVRTDDVLSPMYPAEDFDGAASRLREFLIQRFGGPGRYSAARGHPRLRMRHAPFKVDFVARGRWVKLMDSALNETDLPETVKPVLRRYFHATATFMINQPV